MDWEGEHFTYRSIWHAANVLREAREKDQANGFWSLMGATLLAYTAFEGFLNHGALGFMVWRTASRGRGGSAPEEFSTMPRRGLRTRLLSRP